MKKLCSIFSVFALCFSIHAADTCYVKVNGNSFSWNYNYSHSADGGYVDKTITQPGTNHGYTFDIYDLDNSFNMEINGVKIATNEIQFQSTGTPGINIEFNDGSQYESNTPKIFNFSGNASSPLIRVRISPTGQVTLFGSKSSYGPLFLLQPKTGVGNAFTYNTIPWNINNNNTVKITQLIYAATGIDGYGYGENTVPGPQINAGYNGNICIGETVALTANNPNNATISWDNGAGTNATVSVSPTATTTYTVTYTLNGCVTTATAIVNVNPLPTIDAGTNQTVCEGTSVTLSGAGAGTGTYAWDNSITDGTAFTPAVESLTYTVTGTDGNGCVNTDQVDVIVNPTPTVTVPTGGVVCEGETINLTPSTGGTWLSNNTSVATITNGGEVTGVSQGTADMTFTDGTTGCSSNASAGSITVTASPTIIIPSGGVVCEGSTLNLTPSTGGTWLSNDASVATIDNTGLVTGISQGTADMTFTDGTTGCSNTVGSATITVDPAPTVTIPSGGVVCEGSTLNLTPSTGGTWSSSDASVATITNGGVVTGTSAGTITMTFTDGTTGCSSTSASGTITVNPTPTVTVPSSGVICEGATLSLTPAIGGTWSSSNASVATITNGGQVTGVSQGTTEMVFTNTTTGCSSIASTGTIIVNTAPILTIGEINCNKPKVSYSVGYTTNAGATVTASLGNVTSTAVTGVPNNQQVIITATTAGCPSTSETVSTDDCDVIINVSNGVSPNNDGLNDFFEITDLDVYPENGLTIHNRWGDKVYESSPYKNDWNGQNNIGGLGGKELPAGTYFYILELDKDQDPIKGYIELKR